MCLSVSCALLAGTQSQLNLERSKSRMGTFIDGGPMAETNPDEGYETNFTSCALCSYTKRGVGIYTQEQEQCDVHGV